MAWNNKYWDILSNLYWTPRYLGLKSIARDKWRIEGDHISIPRELIQTSNGPLYFRLRTFDDLLEYLRGQEEILNHFFDLTFSIAGDDVIGHTLCRPLALEDNGPFESVGREIGHRYGWHHQENVTQQDGFFVSSRSLIGVELKLGSKSWPEQIAKYLALMMWEEQVTGTRDQLGLLFVVSESAVETHWSDVGLTSGSINQSFIDHIDRTKVPSRIQKLFDENAAGLKAIADRLKLAVVSWEQFRDGLAEYRSHLDRSKPGDQTLDNLIGGLCSQIDQHGKTGIVKRE